MMLTHKQEDSSIATAYIAIGSNMGDSLQHIDTAIIDLQTHSDIDCVTCGKIYQSKPHGPKDQPDYLNTAIKITTRLSPENLLQALHDIEHKHERKRNEHWGARTLDLDIVLYNNLELKTPSLTLPHPHAHQREFVIQPLLDIDRGLVLPQHGNISNLQLPFHTLKAIRNVTTHYCQTS